MNLTTDIHALYVTSVLSTGSSQLRHGSMSLCCVRIWPSQLFAFCNPWKQRSYFVVWCDVVMFAVLYAVVFLLEFMVSFQWEYAGVVVVVVVPLPQSRSRLAAMLSQLRALQHAGLEGTDTVLAPLLPQWAKKPKLATTATELQLMSAVCHLWGLCCPPNCREQKTNIKYNESLAISSPSHQLFVASHFPNVLSPWGSSWGFEKCRAGCLESLGGHVQEFYKPRLLYSVEG